jgi:phosphate:Na+ symporter
MKRLLPFLFVFNFLFSIGYSQDTLQTSAIEVKQLTTLDKGIFRNINLTPDEYSLSIQWTLDYDLYPNLKDYKLVVAYTELFDAKGKTKKLEWVNSESLPLKTLDYTIKDLKNAKNYLVKIGLVPTSSKTTVWSTHYQAKTIRSWGLINFLILIGALGLFVYGMKIMSEGLQQTAGTQLRNWLKSISSNRLKGVLTGFGVTSVVQSSSVTTVMTVSFVNAGLMTLRESASVMMGANIGTTVTAWIILLIGFNYEISSVSLILIAIVFPLIFINKGKAKSIAQSTLGLVILFISITFLQNMVPDLNENDVLVQFLAEYHNPTFLSLILFIIIGAILTILVQSSTAAFTLTMVLVAKDIIPFEVAAAMIIGGNIGTTITAELASVAGNVHAKRSARIHSIFNVIGAIWVILLFPFFLDFVGDIYSVLWNSPWNPREANKAIVAITILHTTFNIINVFALVWFIPQLVQLVEKTVKSKGKNDEEFRLEFIGTNIVDTPEISIYEAKKEVAKFGELTSKMSKFTRILLTDPDKKIFAKNLEKIAKYEDITDRVEIEVAKYLNKVSEGELTQENSQEIRSLNSITNDLERIGDIFFQISKSIERKSDDKIWFSPEQRQGLLEILTLTDNAFEMMVDNLKKDKKQVNLERANEIESAINSKRDDLRNMHLENMENAEYNMKSGMIFNDLFSSIEKVGDHIINVSEALAGQI